MVVPNEFGDEFRSSLTQMQEICGETQSCSMPRGMQGREMQGTRRQREIGCGAKVRLKRDYF